MPRILKFQLSSLFEYQQFIVFPSKPTILKFDLQRGCPTIWATCEDHGPEHQLKVRQYMTGEAIDPNMDYLGTIISHEDNFVTHYYIESMKS